MSQDPQRFPGWLFALYGSLLASAAACLLMGLANGSPSAITIGGVGLFVSLAALPIAWNLRQAGASADAGSLHHLAASIRDMAEQQALSDDARRVLNRRRERDLLRRAIEEDIAAEDWDAAAVLVKELAEHFGYRTDAEDFRTRIERARAEPIDRRVGEAVRSLDAMLVRREWDAAAAEAERVTRLYPDSPRVQGLRHRVDQARDRYKQDLERRFLHAAREERVDEAMNILKELDLYLTEAEAEPYFELARGVVGKARENLGVQFKLLVQDRDWRRAADVGEQIIREFPNTRMAAEIRQMIDDIRQRAAALPAGFRDAATTA